MICGKNSLVVLALCVLAAKINAVPVAKSGGRVEQVKHTEQLDVDGRYVLSWVIDEETKEIVFEVEAETLGYVGLGISPKGGMTGADIFIGGVESTGTPRIYYGDYHAERNGMPMFDTQQDWKVLEAKENGTHTYLKVSRLLDTCDNQDYAITEESTARVIWSLGATDDLQYHSTNRGTKSINLIPVPQPEVDLENMMLWEIVVNTPMPPEDTTYWCTIHKRPPLQQRHHVVGFDALLPSQMAVSHTHHFIVSKCVAPPGMNATELFEPWVGHPGAVCFDSNTVLPSQYCSQYLFVWAVGGKTTLFPLDAGYSIAGSNDDFYYMIEVHYDNPSELAGLQFETGVRIYYTDEIRPREAVMFALGHDTTPSLLIPPNQTDFVISGHCSPSCTRRLPDAGLNVFNILLHSHISGRKLKLRHFRGKDELKWPAFDDNYDFDFQQNKPLRENVVIMPGDHITFECTYDSTWNNGRVVTGGLSSRQEMCLAFLWTYSDSGEDIRIDSCHSMYSIDQAMLDFGITNWTQVETSNGMDALVLAPPEMAGMLFADAISTIFQWTPDFIADQQRLHRYGVQLSSCCDWSTDECERGIIMYPDANAYTPEPTCPADKLFT